jgi:hypothetical protein
MRTADVPVAAVREQHLGDACDPGDDNDGALDDDDRWLGPGGLRQERVS